MKQKHTATVLSQSEIAPSIFDMWIKTPLAGHAKPGQFIGVYPRDRSTILPRPISVCEVNGERDALRIVYRIAGAGTAEFSGYQAGEPVEILGLLGNGFPLEAARGKRALLLGGGIGVPPILELAKRLEGDKHIILGYRDGGTFLRKDFERCGRVTVASEDGSVGVRGNVLDAVRQEELAGEVIYACGPMPMLRAIKAYAAEQRIQAYISLEEHMACGVGACLGCVVKTREQDSHSHVPNARICTDGPVFDAADVEI